MVVLIEEEWPLAVLVGVESALNLLEVVSVLDEGVLRWEVEEAAGRRECKCECPVWVMLVARWREEGGLAQHCEEKYCCDVVDGHDDDILIL